jgi:hypothetical protein
MLLLAVCQYPTIHISFIFTVGKNMIVKDRIGEKRKT